MSKNVIRQDVIELVTQTNTDELDKLRKELDELKRSINGNVKEPLDRLGNTTAFTKLKKGFSDVSKSIKNFGNQIDSAASAITSKIFNLKSLIVGAIGGTVVKSAIEVVADRQDITSQFEILLGSAEKAKKRVEELTDFAGQTPFSRDEIFRASKQLQVFTGNALSTGNHLKVIGDVAAGTGQNFEDVALWVGRLYDAIKSGNKTGEMTSRLQEMGAISGKDRDIIDNLGTDMKKSWPQVEKILSRFNGTMEKMSNNMNNMLLSLKSFATNNILLPLGEGIASGLQPAIQKFRQFRKTSKADVDSMSETFKKFGENVCVPLFNGIESGVEGTIKIIGALKDGVDGLEKLRGQSGFMDGVINVLQFIIRNKTTILDALQGIALIAGSIVLVSKIQQLFRALQWLTTPLGMISTLAFVAFMVFKKNGGTVQDIINGISKAIVWLKDNIKWLLPVVGSLAAAFAAFKAYSFFKGFGKLIPGNSDKSGGLFSGIINIFKDFASIKTSTVLRGMANMAIVATGLAVITAIVVPILFNIAKNSNLKLITQSSLILLSLGVVGTALTKLADKVGDIPIRKVATGLANMSMALTSMGALLWIADKAFKNGIDLKEMAEVAALCGVFGVVGTALTKLANITEKIPILKVLKGLANIGTTLIPMGALVWTASKVFGEGINLREMLEVAALCGVFGVVGTALSKFAKSAAKIPVRKVSLGLANMAIMLVPMGALAWIASEVFKNGINLKEMLKVSAFVGVLGVLGTALSEFSRNAGNIPVRKVSLGLANMIIMLVPLGAIAFAASEVFKNGINLREMLKVSAFVGVLGILGTALSELARNSGNIPIRKVSKGLTNINISLVSIGAVAFTASEVFKNGINLKEMLKVSAFVGVLGILGSVLSEFARNAGNIPIRKVSKGLTNIGISLVSIGALAWTATKVFGEGINLREMFKVSAFVGILGTIGTALAWLASKVGNISTGKLSLGLANIAIVLVGLGALAWTATKVFKGGIDLKEMLKVSALVGVLGVLGSGLSVFAGIVGLIPFLLVIKGLANIALVLGGLGALVWTADKIFKDGIDFGQMYDLIKLISLLGIAGSALSVLAGAVGLVPFPLVITGLASIATVIGGLSAILLAASALGSMPGFDDFVNNGGDTLAKMFAQVGKVCGAVVGGFGEGISSTLPKIGENLGKFGENLKPLLKAFDGVDVKSICDFFTGISSFLLKMTGNELLSKITGGTNLVGLGNELSSFADSSKHFFETIAALPEGAITQASALFNALAMIKEIPESGGFAQLFGGDKYEGLKALAGQLPTLADGIQKFYEAVGDRTDFSALSSLFNALALVKELPESGGFQQFFNGDTLTSLKTLTTELPYLATGVQRFYEAVGDRTDFSAISSLFNALASVKELPKSGGFSQFFNGDVLTSLKTLMTSLPELGSAIQTFYESIGDRADFTALSALFNALASIKELPKKGGFLQFFTGDPLESLKSMKDALPGLGEGVKSFFESLNGIDDFSKINSLFNALASIKELPKDNDIWTKVGDAITGQETKSQLAVIGEDLKSFSENTTTFFEQVNALNITNLYGLWEGLKGAKDISSDTFNVVSENVDKIVDKITELPNLMADGIKSGGDALKDSLVSIWVEAAKAMAQPVNKVIEGANWILKEFGSDKRVASWTPYAKGTNGHKGGNALVNDGRGAELVQMPNGRTFIPQGRNVFIPNAPKGMKVLPAEQTANMLGRKNPTFRYANGTGDIDIWSYIDDAKGLISQIDKKFVSYDGLSGFPLNAGQSMVSMIEGQMTGWAEKLYDEMGAKSLASYVASEGVEQWRSTVCQALKMVGQYSEDNVKRTLYQMQTESGGNPRAINLWDSNAKKGTPSKGLMQVIDPTFASYAMPGHNSNIYDPLSNILASLRYAISRYGSLAKAYRGTGYANGGIANKPSIFGEDGEEMAIPLSKDKRKRGLGLWAQAGEMLGVRLPSYDPESAGYGGDQVVNETNNFNPSFSITINGAEDTRSMERKIKQFVSEALEETFESMARKTPVRQY